MATGAPPREKGRRQMTFAERAGRRQVQIVTVLLFVQLDMHIESELEADASFNVEQALGLDQGPRHCWGAVSPATLRRS
eukprot:9185326-Pyramimonas_sp.AAC.1